MLRQALSFLSSRALVLTAPLFGAAALTAPLTAHAADQCIHANSPSPLEICVSDTGQPRVYVQQPNGRTPQYFGEDSWGSVIRLGGGANFSTGYVGGTPATPVSNARIGSGSQADPYVITTVVDLGASGVRMTQKFMYVTGDRAFRKTWTLANTGATTYSNVRFFHGGDTLFGGLDSARAWYDDVGKMVYVTNASFDNSGYMGFYANPATPAARYYGGHYSAGNNYASSSDLPNTTNSTYSDAGYYLQWNRTSLAPGQSWTFEGFETWSASGALQVLPPADDNVEPGTVVRKIYKVHNLAGVPLAITLSGGTAPNGWSYSLPNGTSYNLGSLEVASIPVDITVPNAAGDGVVENVSLTATSGSYSNTGSARLTTFVAGFTLAPTSFTATDVPVGTNADRTFTVTNGGGAPPVEFGQLYGASAPFSVVSDACSNTTLAAGAACSVVVRFTPATGGSFNASFSLPIVAPVFTTRSITYAATGLLPTYVVSTSAGAGGAISPTSANVTHGQTTSFTVTANTGYSIGTVSGCGGSRNGATFTTGAITGACTVSASFNRNQYAVTATAGANGSISPSNAIVLFGDSTTFTLTPNDGFAVSSVSGCGGTLNGTTYTVPSVAGACSVQASFEFAGPVFEVPQLPEINVSSRELFTALPGGSTPLARDYAGAPLSVELTNPQTRYAPGTYTLVWRAVDSRGLVTTREQVMRVWPTVSFGPDLTIGGKAGNFDSFRVSLNGASPVYPFIVDYTATGDRSGTDLEDGRIVFEEGETEKQISFAILASMAPGTADRQVQLHLSSELNRGSEQPLTITITALNRAPAVRLSIEQGGEERTSVARDAGPITLAADIRDPNTNDTHSVQWIAPAGAVYTVTDGVLTLQPNSLPVGVHRFELVVTDSGMPPSVTRSTFEIVVRESAPVLPAGATALLPNGLPDHPDYAPAVPNVLPERVGELTHHLMESDPGTVLALGSYSQLRAAYQTELQGALSASTLPSDATVNVGGYFDFRIDGLPRVGDPVNIVIPQRAQIPARPVYRKYIPATQRWQTFVEDVSNEIASARGSEGYCPPPASDEYRPGLNAGDWCVRLTIVDGGPNDTDGQANGSVSDPGGVGSLSDVVVTGSSKGKGGGGGFGVFAVLASLGLAALRIARTRAQRRAALAVAMTAVAAQAGAQSGGQAEAVDARPHWYAGIELGNARSDFSAANLTAKLQDRGHDVTARIHDQTRSAWRVHGGYEWRRFIGVEAGYIDLGEVETSFTGAIADVAPLLEDANRLHPASAEGFDASVIARYEVLPRLTVHARGGAFLWESKFRTHDDAGQLYVREDDGLDELIGAGASIDLLNNWRVGADWTRYSLADSNVELFGFKVTYRW